MSIVWKYNENCGVFAVQLLAAQNGTGLPAVDFCTEFMKHIVKMRIKLYFKVIKIVKVIINLN